MPDTLQSNKQNRQFEAIVFSAPNEIELRRFDLPACSASEIVVKTLYTMVSSGTEGRVLAGHYGADGNFPLIPGYAVIGEVVEVGPSAGAWQVGDLVSAGNPQKVEGVHQQWGGHASFHVYDAAKPVLLPRGAAPLDYIVTELAAISFRGARMASPKAGEVAAVIGQGLIGAFSAAWLGVFGCRVVVADVAPSRLERALKIGASAAVDARDSNASARLKSLCGRADHGGADIVIESSGNARGFALATGLLREDWTNGAKKSAPRLVLQANYIEEMPLNPCNFFAGEAVQVFAPVDRRREDRLQVVEHLRRGDLRAADFVGEVTAPHEAASAYERLRDAPDECFSVTFDWSQI